MVDDEVDQATVNRKRGEDYFVTEEDITPINRMTSDLASTYDLSYLGYTATHQANVLAMHAEETLYPESAFVLDSHPLYLGPIAVFHTYRNRLVEPHQVMDLSIPKGRVRPCLPQATDGQGPGFLGQGRPLPPFLAHCTAWFPRFSPMGSTMR